MPTSTGLQLHPTNWLSVGLVPRYGHTDANKHSARTESYEYEFNKENYDEIELLSDI